VTSHCEGVGPLRNERRASKAQPSEKEDGGGTLRPAGTLSGDRSGQAALRREQREQLESNNCENGATGKV
jgi:hypothetical protein